MKKLLKPVFWLLIAWGVFGNYNHKAGRVLLKEYLDDGGKVMVRMLPSTRQNAFFWYEPDASPIYRFEYYRPKRAVLDSAQSYQRIRYKAAQVSLQKENGGNITVTLDGKPVCTLTYDRLWIRQAGGSKE